ncbi:MAG: hypothetical protein KGH84_11985, partial [Paracoccaceae bacterium]|nr:hypothetical protein [Paracoccaceae bacterium]
MADPSTTTRRKFPIEAQAFSRYADEMDTSADFEIFLVAPPGLESVLCDEAREKRFADPVTVP